MWGKRKKRCSQLQRQLALGRLEEAMGWLQQEEGPEPETALPYYQGAPLPIPPPGRPGLGIADVPVDNSTGPDPSAAADEPESATPVQQELPAQRRGQSSNHGSF
jgi:hypothetical protein